MQLDLFKKIEEVEKEHNQELHCRKCNKFKPLSSFNNSTVKFETEPRPKGSAGIAGTARYCKSCKKTYDAGKAIAVKLAGKKPLKPSPCNCCGIMTTPEKLCLDHDHITLSFRGWLCRSCNIGLGALGDNVESLEKAISYLNRSKGT